jgi:hypothetical protein
MARIAVTGRRRRGRRALLVTGWLAAGSLVAALPAVGPASGAATPGHRVNDNKDGFSLVLPPGWNQVSLSGPTLGSLIGVSNLDPNIKAALTSEAKNDASRNLKLYAVALSQLNGTFLPTIVVGTFKGSGSRAVLDPEVKGFFTEEGASQVKITNVRLPFGKAVEGTYLLTSSSSASFPVWETQVYAPHAGKVYVATFSALTQPACELTAAVVMGSWRFT